MSAPPPCQPLPASPSSLPAPPSQLLPAPPPCQPLSLPAPPCPSSQRAPPCQSPIPGKCSLTKAHGAEALGAAFEYTPAAAPAGGVWMGRVSWMVAMPLSQGGLPVSLSLLPRPRQQLWNSEKKALLFHSYLSFSIFVLFETKLNFKNYLWTQ